MFTAGLRWTSNMMTSNLSSGQNVNSSIIIIDGLLLRLDYYYPHYSSLLLSYCIFCKGSSLIAWLIWETATSWPPNINAQRAPLWSTAWDHHELITGLGVLNQHSVWICVEKSYFTLTCWGKHHFNIVIKTHWDLDRCVTINPYGKQLNLQCVCSCPGTCTIVLQCVCPIRRTCTLQISDDYQSQLRLRRAKHGKQDRREKDSIHEITCIQHAIGFNMLQGCFRHKAAIWS